ncbi:MAG: efflux transporter outer membrane subunit [Undibacterium curvum]|uniref:efflux transporter outer membrane subunit n=1 Tax=Undibacterium curvum TaxID=2762294 RepID=UPI003BE2B2B8
MKKHCSTIVTSCLRLLLATGLLCGGANLALCHARSEPVRAVTTITAITAHAHEKTTADQHKVTDRWWQDFADVHLNQLIESALAANHDLGIATARLEQARALVDGANAERRPRLDAVATAQRSRDGAASTMLDRTALGLRAAWEVDVFGRAAAGVSAAKAEAESARHAWEASRIVLAADVATTYFELRTLEQRQDVLSEVISIAQRQLEVSLRKLEAGSASSLDAERWRAELAQEQASKAQLDGQYQSGLHRLSILLGSSQLPVLGKQQISMNFPAAPGTMLPIEWLERRPDVQRQARALDAALARAGVARRELYPSLQISWSGARERLAEKGASAAPGFALGYGLSLNLPILDGGRIRSNIELHDARAKEAMSEYEKAMLTALVDVDSRLSLWSATGVALEQWQGASIAAELASRHAARLYEAGVTDLSAVLDARRAQFKSRDALVQATGARWEAAIGLRRAFAGSL